MPRNRDCVVCGKEFEPRSGVHKFCSDSCRGKWKYMNGSVSTDSQYLQISGNWNRYCSRLIYCAGKKRSQLTAQGLLKKLEDQNYRCAISGVELTCKLEKGTVCKTNASIDRIDAGGSYSEENIQLVCRAVNSWRSDTPLDEFVEWCRKVVAFNSKKLKEKT